MERACWTSFRRGRRAAELRRAADPDRLHAHRPHRLAEELAAPDYWVRARPRGRPLRRRRARPWTQAGARTFLELGPDGTLTALAQECVAEDAGCAAVLRRDRARGRGASTAGLARLHVRGVKRRLARRLRRAAAPGGSTCRPTPSSTSAYWLDRSAPAAADVARGRARLGRPPAARRGRGARRQRRLRLHRTAVLRHPPVAGRPRGGRHGAAPGHRLRRTGDRAPATRSAATGWRS